MTTRSGKQYTATVDEISTGEDRGVTMEQMLQALLDDRQRRDQELREERERRDREMTDERRRHEEEMLLLRNLAEGARRRDEAVVARRGLDGVKLTKLADGDDIEAFLTVFERVMAAQEISEERWPFMLAPQLTGKAQQAYAAMSAASAADYRDLKEAILLRYDINGETYRQRFRQARQRQGETPRELATRLQDMAKKWLKDCGTVEAILEAVVLEQLLETLPAEIRVWVRERKPTTSAQAGQMAEDYLQARRITRPATVSKVEPPRKVESRSIPGGQRCHTCGELGHFARDCKSKAKAGGSSQTRGMPGRSKEGIRCYNCGRWGHVAMNCPSKAAMYCGPARRRSEVERCGRVEGRLVKGIVLDTGCSRTLVRQDLVPPEKRTRGEVSVRCAHGDVVSYQLAEVEMEVEGLPIRVEVGIVPNLPILVLLGTDVPGLVDLLHPGLGRSRTQEALMVSTRAQKRRADAEAAIQAVRELQSGAQPKPVENLDSSEEEAEAGRELGSGEEQRGSGEEQQGSGEEPPVGDEELGSGEERSVGEGELGSCGGSQEVEENPGMQFDDAIFAGGRQKVRLTRSQKRANRCRYAAQGGSPSGQEGFLDMTSDELRDLQEKDGTLAAVRRAAGGEACSAGIGFFPARWTSLQEVGAARPG